MYQMPIYFFIGLSISLFIYDMASPNHRTHEHK